MIVVGRWAPNRIVVGLNGHFGVLPAALGVGGDFPNPWLNDVDPGDEATEFAGVVQTLPGSGVVTLNDRGEFTHTGAADGTYITTDTRYTWPPGGPIVQHAPDEQITTVFGASSSGTAPGATLTAAAALVPGAASGNSSASAPGATIAAVASLLAGTASGPASAAAAGVVLTAAAALVAGSASSGSAYLPQPTTSATWSYRQTATIWRLTGRDSWGGQVTHAAPGLFLCDYAEDERRIRLASGEEFTSQLLIYTSLPGVQQGDMVLIGESSNPDPYAAGASEVRAVRTWADTFNAEGAPDFRIAT